MDTIVAVGTALSESGIAIVRISGEDCVNMVTQLFRFKGKSLADCEERKMHLGTFSYDGISDVCLGVRFQAPYSFTGEDVVELHLHGGVRLAMHAVQACIAKGARLARPGEFTQRAFLNGKMTLAQAEGTAHAISAASDAELRASFALSSGTLSVKIGEISDALIDLISDIEVAIDYPEEDVEVASLDVLQEKIALALRDVEKLLDTRHTGKIVADGLNIALLGKPNVGKSSLLNALVGEDCAIVTDVAGTTRDRLTERIQHRGVRFNLVDTAGLRESDDLVEKIGIDRSREAAKTCDLALIVTDHTFGAEDEDIIASVTCPKIIVANKTDLGASHGDHLVCAKTGEGVEELKQKIYDTYVDGDVIAGGMMLTDARHVSALTEAKNCLVRALECFEPAVMTVDLRQAVAELGKIDGATVSEEITDAIFAKFCLGK